MRHIRLTNFGRFFSEDGGRLRGRLSSLPSLYSSLCSLLHYSYLNLRLLSRVDMPGRHINYSRPHLYLLNVAPFGHFVN